MYPIEATVIGFILASLSIGMIPLVALYKLRTVSGPIKQVTRLQKTLLRLSNSSLKMCRGLEC